LIWFHMRAAILYAIDFLDFSGSAPFRDKKKGNAGVCSQIW
jgi:hypothetical protein